MRMILASKSPRRQELLKMIGVEYEVVVSEKEEVKDLNLSPLENGIQISLEKAKEVLEKTDGNRIIISCDTIVVKENQIYGKPKTREEAYQMLKVLSGTSHEVISCLTVIKVQNEKKEIYQEQGVGVISIDKLSDEEIYDWIDKAKPYDKAGAYAIQESFGKHISKIEGDYYSVVGLPLNKLYHILKKIN